MSNLVCLLLAGLLFAAPATASPYDCRNPAYATAHSDECQQPGSPFLLGGGQSNGGGQDILTRIGRALGIL